MIDIEHEVGRLTEVTAIAPLSVEQLQAFIQKTRGIYGAYPGKLISCIEMRQLKVLPQDQVDMLIGLLKADSPKVERTAFLLPEAGTMIAIQFERIIAEGNNPNRRIFRDAASAQAWLGELLTRQEQDRLAKFLAGSRT